MQNYRRQYTKRRDTHTQRYTFNALPSKKKTDRNVCFLSPREYAHTTVSKNSTRMLSHIPLRPGANQFKLHNDQSFARFSVRLCSIRARTGANLGGLSARAAERARARVIQVGNTRIITTSCARALRAQRQTATVQTQWQQWWPKESTRQQSFVCALALSKLGIRKLLWRIFWRNSLYMRAPKS